MIFFSQDLIEIRTHIQENMNEFIGKEMILLVLEKIENWNDKKPTCMKVFNARLKQSIKDGSIDP